MSQTMENQSPTNTDIISLYEILSKARSWALFLLTKWWVLIIAVIIGGAAGIGYTFYKPVTYTARLSFLVEEGKSGGSGLAAIAGQFGFDLGGLSGGNGLLSGENVLVFLKSTSLVRETLVTPYDSAGSFSLADRYAEVYRLKDKWKKDSRVGKEVYFPVALQQSYTRLQDSLLQVIVANVLKEELFIEKPDKKASFVQVTVEMKDELLAKFFCERLVEEATGRYIFSKTSRQAINVGRLQQRADSIGLLLNRKTHATAVAQEQLLDINPAYNSVNVAAEVSGRDKVLLATIYGEVIKNLEISKVALSQETPTIQVVDDVMLPLKVNKAGKLTTFLLGAVIAMILAILLLTVRFMMSYRFPISGS